MGTKNSRPSAPPGQRWRSFAARSPRLIATLTLDRIGRKGLAPHGKT
jgi:hypothetical protein